MSGCNCEYCRDGRAKRQEYRHGGIDDGWEDEPYKKGSRSNWNGRKRRACKKSKTGEPCDKLGTTVKGTIPVYDTFTREYVGNKPRVIKCCSRCGKEDWSSYRWW